MVPPSRRAVLASLGSIGLAGCFDGRPGGSQNSGDDASVPEYLQPGADRDSLPAYDVDHLISNRARDPDRTRIYVEPDVDALGPGGRIEFTLRNRSDVSLDHNPYRWSIHKHEDGEWYPLEPRPLPEPETTLPPGTDHGWGIGLDNEGIADGDPVERVLGDGTEPLRGLGGGRYAFATEGSVADDSFDGSVGFVSRFDVDAPSLEVVPTDAVVETEWEDDVLVGSSSRGDPDAAYTRLGAYELERVEPTDDAEELITELVLRNHRLRDVLGLALETDAERVRLEEYDATTPLFGTEEPGIYEYDGLTFEIETRELGD